MSRTASNPYALEFKSCIYHYTDLNKNQDTFTIHFTCGGLPPHKKLSTPVVSPNNPGTEQYIIFTYHVIDGEPDDGINYRFTTDALDTNENKTRRWATISIAIGETPNQPEEVSMDATESVQSDLKKTL